MTRWDDPAGGDPLRSILDRVEIAFRWDRWAGRWRPLLDSVLVRDLEAGRFVEVVKLGRPRRDRSNQPRAVARPRSSSPRR